MEVRGEVCETEIRAGQSAECQSCCRSWPLHMAPFPGHASRCATSESACVCAYLHTTGRQTPTRTLCEDNGLCNDYRITPLSHPPVFVATSITVMDTVRLLSPRYDMTQCDITHMLPPRGWWSRSADQRRTCVEDGLNWEGCCAGPVGKLILEVMDGAEEKKEKDGGV